MTETPQVVQIARQGRAHTVEITDQVTLDLAKAWVRAWDALSPEGSSPLARGALGHRLLRQGRAGLIPARAGSTGPVR